MLKKLLITIGLLGLAMLWPASVHATTINAANCTQSAVLTAVNSAVDGDTVVIPACAQTNWGDGVTSGNGNVTVTHCIEIKGAGQGVTILGDNVKKDGASNSMMLTWSVSCGTRFAKFLHDVTIVGVATDPSIFNKGHLRITGSATYPGGFRIYNVTGTSMQTSFATTDWVGPGLFDHLTFPTCGAAHGSINMKSTQWAGGGSTNTGNGNGSWADPTPLPGSLNAIYIEDSSWTCSGLAPAQFVDGDAGARWVARFNTLFDANGGGHGTDTSQAERSLRWKEIYKNGYTFDATEAPDFVDWYRGGSGIFWGNTVSAAGGINTYVKAQNCRDGTSCAGSYPPWGLCNGTSSYDQNASGGYRCVDQPGSGTSNQVSCASPPCTSGATPTPVAWVGNALSPIYAFKNTGTSQNLGMETSTNVVQERDIYSDMNGHTGVASGTKSQMPASCTGNSGFWVTDEAFWNAKTPGVAGGQLYKCNGSTFQLYYTPAVYPHPFQSQTGWTYVQDSIATNCTGPTSSCVLQTSNILPTTAGTIWVVEIQSTNNVTISSVTGGGGSWQLCPASSCHIFNATLGRNADMAFNLTGNGGTTSITVNLSGSSGTIFGANFFEFLPPPGATASFGSAGTNFSTTCTGTCTASTVTLSGTDLVLQAIHANSSNAWNAWSSPYQTLPLGEGLLLDATSGAAPTVTVSGTGLISHAISFTSTAGTFTPSPKPLSVANFTSTAPFVGVSCSPSCSLNIPSTGSGRLLFLHAANLNGNSISSVSGGGTWVVPTGCQVTLTSTADRLSCAYVLSSTSGATSLNITMTGSGTEFFGYWEVASTAGPFSLDGTPASAQRSASFFPSGVSLSLTGTNDIIFQSIFVPGGTSAVSWYPYPRIPGSGTQFFDSNAAGAAVLNVSTSVVPQWVNQQNNATAVTGIAFKVSAQVSTLAPPTNLHVVPAVTP